MFSLPPGLKLRPLSLVDPLPRFLIARDLDSPAIYVIHTRQPRFIARVIELAPPAERVALEIVQPGFHPFYWTDYEPADLNDPHVKNVLRDAGLFYGRSLDTPAQN